MSKENIPATIKYTCDRCKTDNQKNFEYGGLNGKIHIWCRDMLGNAGGSTLEIDLCNNCSNDFNKFVFEYPKKNN